ncbi:ribosome silencing factor [candidate division KSB1 bacterium]|nr:ribosome silencing factor [candidate division KSB1 bacterium]
MTSQELAHYIANLTLDKKAEDVLILDLGDITTLTDYFVICSAQSDVQVKAISDMIIEKTKEQNIKVWHSEGFQSLNWVLLDFVDVVVHIFKPDIRNYYGLEKLWGDANIIEVKDEH